MTSQNRTKVIQVRVTEEELARVEHLAVLQGTTISELCREYILKYILNQQTIQVVTIMSRQTLLNLSQISDSIKLISKKVKPTNGFDAEVSTELKKVQNLIQQLYHKITT